MTLDIRMKATHHVKASTQEKSMPRFRVHVTLVDLTVVKWDYDTEFSAGARELATKRIKDENIVGARIGKVKLVRDLDPCCVC